MSEQLAKTDRARATVFESSVEIATKEANQSRAEDGGSSVHESSALVGVNSTQLHMIHWKWIRSVHRPMNVLFYLLWPVQLYDKNKKVDFVAFYCTRFPNKVANNYVNF